MKRIFILLLIILPSMLFSNEYEVPGQTDGNKLILSVNNNYPFIQKNIIVNVKSAPDWIVFKKNFVTLDSIPPYSQQDITFEFKTLYPNDQQKGNVIIETKSPGDILLNKKIITLSSKIKYFESKLEPVYPNPTNQSITINYIIRSSSYIKLEVYNLLGQRIRTLIHDEKLAGKWTLDWDCRDDGGNTVSSGVYLIKMQIKENDTNEIKQLTTKCLLQK